MCITYGIKNRLKVQPCSVNIGIINMMRPINISKFIVNSRPICLLIISNATFRSFCAFDSTFYVDAEFDNRMIRFNKFIVLSDIYIYLLQYWAHL